MQRRIHLAYGFHVNCYHSYRGDTPDGQGFGSDLRIIRKIIDALDQLNAEGIPVKGTWDCDNFFSLARILPQYAPEILEGMRRRIRTQGDAAILMGYSNGALGAMDAEELAASVELAVTNPEGSGAQDLFGSCQRIVRPQEMMFTPSQVPLYRKLGVRALCLYYSCVPFDAFKTLIPQLPPAQAFNPLDYVWEGERLTVIPTYSNADVCDAGCLRAWVQRLHRQQLAGEIDRDLFLFINMDADAIFWESLDLPVLGSRLANTDGIRGLVREVADLDYVVFDTPGGYLDTHASAGQIQFLQDTADGNYTGYASWAEKPMNRVIWTAIERSRQAHRAQPDPEAFLDRVKLLSTTHFGLATPVLNLQRERTAQALAHRITQAALRTDGPLTIHNITGSDLQCLQLRCRTPLNDVAQLRVTAEGLLDCTVLPADAARESVWLMLRFDRVQPTYTLAVETDAAAAPARPLPDRLASGGTAVEFGADHRLRRITFYGRQLGGADFLRSYLTYGGKHYDFSFTAAAPAEIAGGCGVCLSGSITLPQAETQGSFRFTFFTSEAAEGVFVLTEVQYPYTPERDAISTENSTLGRFSDLQWQEVVPFCLAPAQRGSVKVWKRSFNGAVTAFDTATFAQADPRNAALASFNHQLTAGLVGASDGSLGLLLANARAFNASMAHCPMRLQADGRVLLNPFGTFSGPQRHHPNQSGDRIPLTYTLIAPQGKSLAPAYNGVLERSLLCLQPFEGSAPDSACLQRLLAFADGAYATGSSGGLTPFDGENVQVHAPCGTAPARLRSPLLTGIRGNLGRYAVRGVRAVSYIARAQRKAKKQP